MASGSSAEHPAANARLLHLVPDPEPTPLPVDLAPEVEPERSRSGAPAAQEESARVPVDLAAQLEPESPLLPEPATELEQEGPLLPEPAVEPEPAPPAELDYGPRNAPPPVDLVGDPIEQPINTSVDANWVNEKLGGRYRVQRLLGEGAMGTVFVAEHATLKKEVALKVIHPRLSVRHSSVKRFHREARLASRIDHPNVVSIIDYGMLDEAAPYITMRLIRGASLADLLDSGPPLPWPTAASLAAQIADALVAARAHGVIHRDLKPSNILVEPTGRGREPLVKVLDFGVAKLDPNWSDAAHDLSQLTPCGVVVGTAGYMAPEQCVGGEVTHRTDLYALGVLMWEAMVGERLFSDVRLLELLQEQQQAVDKCDRLIHTGAPRRIQDLVRRLLAYAASDRPASAEEVRDELRRALWDANFRNAWFADEQPVGPGRGGDAQPMSDVAGARQDDLPTEVDTHAGPTAAGERWRIRRWRQDARVWAGVAAAMLLVLAAAALAIFQPGPGSDDTAGPSQDARVAALMTGETRTDRVAAAESLLASPDAGLLPAYIHAAARMQLARTCAGKRRYLRDLSAQPTPQARPLLERLDGMERTGCGSRGTRDCIACMRDDVQAALSALSSTNATGN